MDEEEDENKSIYYLLAHGKEVLCPGAYLVPGAPKIIQPKPVSLTIDIEKPGTVSKILTAQTAPVEQLIIRGVAKDSDLKAIKKVKKALRVLDLRDVVIEELPDVVFEKFPRLEVVIMPLTLKVVGGSALRECERLNKVVLPEGLKVIKCWAMYSCGELREVNFPSTLEEIQFRALSYTKLDSLILPDSLIEYANGIDYRGAIENLRLPQPVTTFPSGLRLDVETFQIPATVTSISNYAFQDWRNLKSIVIPGGVTELPRYTFNGCVALEDVTIPGSVKVIEQNCFAYCKSLTHIGLPEGLQEIYHRAFADCSKLKVVELPSSVTMISSNVFEGDKALETIILNENLATVGEAVLAYCEGLKTVICKAVNPPATDNRTFKEEMRDNCRSYYGVRDFGGVVLRVPAGSIAAYRKSPWGKAFARIEAI